MKYIGIDIAKSNFVAAFPQDSGYTTASYKNDRDSISIFLSHFDESSHYSVLKATGNYEALLVKMILESEVSV